MGSGHICEAGADEKEVLLIIDYSNETELLGVGDLARVCVCVCGRSSPCFS